MAKSTGQFGPFKLLNRRYVALCEHINVRKLAPNNTDPTEVVDLKFKLYGVRPSDLKGSPLLEAAFVKNDPAAVQETIESITEKSAVKRKEAEYDAGFQVMALTSGSRSDEEKGMAVNVYPTAGLLLANYGEEGCRLSPRSGIQLKVLEPGTAGGVLPTVDIVIAVKGLEIERASDGWLTGQFEVEFEPKVETEIAEEFEKVKPGRKKKAAEGQGDIEFEAVVA